MKKALFLFVVCLLLFQTAAEAQIVFERRYGSDNKSYEQIQDAVTTDDGSLLIAGITEITGAGSYDIFLHKIHPDGSETWIKTLGGPRIDAVSGIVSATGGEYFISGYSLNPANNSHDAFLIKLDESGSVIWRKDFGTAATDVSMSLCRLSGGNIAVFGFTSTPNNQAAIFRALFDPSSGAQLFYGLETSPDEINEMKARPTSDGGCLVATSVGFFFSGSSSLKKYDAQLNPQWSAPVSGLGAPFGEVTERLFDFQTSSNGIFYLTRGNGSVSLIRGSFSGTMLSRRRLATSAYGGGMRVFAGDTVVAGIAEPLKFVFKKLTPTGAVVDSSNLSANFLNTSDLRFLFPDKNRSYYLHNNNNTAGYLAAAVINLQTPVLAWQQNFSEPETPDREQGLRIAAMADGGFVLAGTRQNAEEDDNLWLLKANAAGLPVWEKSIQLSKNFFNDAELGSVESDNSGNIVVLAATDNFQGDIHLLKFTGAGDSLFDKTILTAQEYVPDFFRALPLNAGGFIVGYTRDFDGANPSPTLIRLNASGNILWTKEYAGSELGDIAALTDGGFLIVGRKGPAAWMLKTDASGNMLWEKTHTRFTYNRFISAAQAPDGSLFASGETINPVTLTGHSLILKANASGDALWLVDFGKGSGTVWTAATVVPDNQGGACFAGQYFELPTNIDHIASIFRARISANALNASGAMISGQVFGADDTYPFYGSADMAADGNLLIVSTLGFGSALQDGWVVKTDCKKSSAWFYPHRDDWEEPSFAPNPASDQTRVEWTSACRGPVILRLIDARGRLIQTFTAEKNEEQWSESIPLAGMPSGLYYLEIETAQGVVTGKISIEK